ncbi:hypothetical protein [Chitinimonas koreensis]|uniref:hypothetical protein n=1 Tax=Chitinimonas koreensis TaxID=356302 RepID=UPI00048C167E|nr:hypothetical protein [Chitinimonas koreensis]QNM94848.1 hypothetical protein H9L41_12990 [Chitinimonas koreensis]
MRNLLALCACITVLTGCGTLAFKPAEYPLRDGLIPAFNVSGDVAISNAQPSAEPVIVYSYVGSQLSSDLQAITETMVQQTRKELQKNGNRTGAGGEKTMAIKVNSLLSTYTNAFFWKSNIEFRVTLGNGQTLDFKVPHTSGSLMQDLNGCIAEGVLVLLKDERVRSYLAG